MRVTECVFCQKIARGEIVAEGERSVAFADAHPLTPGHLLIVPTRHVARLLELSRDEVADLWLLAIGLADRNTEQWGTADFNIGLNEGPLAGQTIGHVHLHLIPRRAGDVTEARGGIRWIIPERAAYWRRPSG